MKKRNTSNNPLFIKTSGYPIELITNYRTGKISRQQFCHEWAKLQGFDDTVKGYGNKQGIYLKYRGRTARIINCLLTWGENHKTHTAKTIREMKNKIDAQGEKWT